MEMCNKSKYPSNFVIITRQYKGLQHSWLETKLQFCFLIKNTIFSVKIMFIISDFENCANIRWLHPQCQVKDVFHKVSYSSVWIASCLPSNNGHWKCKVPSHYFAAFYSDDQYILYDLFVFNCDKRGVDIT